MTELETQFERCYRDVALLTGFETQFEDCYKDISVFYRVYFSKWNQDHTPESFRKQHALWKIVEFSPAYWSEWGSYSRYDVLHDNIWNAMSLFVGDYDVTDALRKMGDVINRAHEATITACI